MTTTPEPYEAPESDVIAHIKAKRLRFSCDALLGLAIDRAHQRNNVFANGIGSNRRSKVRDSLFVWLRPMEDLYKDGGVTDRDHIANIERLADDITRDHHQLLHRSETTAAGRYRIGTAQKALNLYLKFLWCADMIRTPPHCPFDRRIIAKLPDVRREWRDWTKLNDIEGYEHLVSQARLVAGEVSLSVWELREWRR